jgi:hypothetical protein
VYFDSESVVPVMACLVGGQSGATTLSQDVLCGCLDVILSEMETSRRAEVNARHKSPRHLALMNGAVAVVNAMSSRDLTSPPSEEAAECKKLVDDVVLLTSVLADVARGVPPLQLLRSQFLQYLTKRDTVTLESQPSFDGTSLTGAAVVASDVEAKGDDGTESDCKSADDNSLSYRFPLASRVRIVLDTQSQMRPDRCVVAIDCTTGEEKAVVMPPMTRSVTKESAHPYADNMDTYEDVHIPGASSIEVVFDPKTALEDGCVRLLGLRSIQR